MKKSIHKILLVVFLGISLSPAISIAADKYTLLEPLPCIEGVGGCQSGTMQPQINLNDYIGYIFKFAIALAAFLAVVMIIWGGFEYMLSEVPNSKLDGKSKIWNAIWGLLGVLASYLILATIDPRLVEINTSIPPILVCSDKIKENCIDTSDVTKFQNQLAEDISKLSLVDQKDISSSVSNIDRLEKEKRLLMEGYRNDGNNVSKDEYDKEIAKIDAEIKLNKSNVIKIDALSKEISLFANIIATEDKTTQDMARKELLDKITEAKKKLDAIKDIAGVQELENQRKFFMEEIDEQKYFLEQIGLYKSQNKKNSVQKNILENDLARYTSQLGQSSDNPKIDRIYQDILKQRIALITDILK